MTGFPFGDPPAGSGEHVWERLSKKAVTDISRRAVSLASFKGSFYCCKKKVPFTAELCMLISFCAGILSSQCNALRSDL
jgi:hypothetical protein